MICCNDMSMLMYTIANIPFNEAARESAVFRSRALISVDKQIFSSILQDARREFRVGAAAINIIYQDWAYFIATSGVADGVYRRSTSFCAHAILAPHDITVVADATLDDRFVGNPFVDAVDGIRFYAGAPILDHEDFPLGTMCVFDGKARHGFSASDEACLRHLSSAAMVALQRFSHAGVDNDAPD